jgi:hypothetical protein
MDGIEVSSIDSKKLSDRAWAIKKGGKLKIVSPLDFYTHQSIQNR